MAEVVNRLVLDLSHHNTVSSWAQIRQAGIVGVIYKATEDDDYTDPTYAEARKGAEGAGLLWGAYHFLRPTSGMVEQARHFVQKVGNLSNVLLCADHEDDGVSLADLKIFLEEVFQLSGQRAVIYSGSVIKQQVGNQMIVWLGAYPRFWLAHYSPSPTWPKQIWSRYWLWQYTDGVSGPLPQDCPGVGGDVDCDSFLGDSARLKAEWTGNMVPVPSKPVVEITISAPPGVEVKVTRE